MENTVANGELKDSLVVCESSQGLEIRGRLVKLTRFAAVFEIFSPDSDLRMSEVLNRFRVVFHEHTVYSGRATVNNLMRVGQVTVCSAMLEEMAWTDLQVESQLLTAGFLHEKFREFLAGWQKSYRIKPEYKQVVSDMQNFLADFRLWVEQIESGLNGKSPGKNDRKIAEAIAQSAFPSIDALFEKYEQVASRIESGLEGVHQVYVRRQLHPLLLCAPFANRAVTKPMGYAGDYGIVNMILEDPHQGESLYAKVLHRWFVKQPPAEAHRNRVKYLTARLYEESLRSSRLPGGKMRAYNVGAGPAREVQDFMAEHGISDTSDFTLVDFNEETLAYGKKVLQESRQRNGRRTHMRFIKKSVGQLLKTEGKITRRTFDQQYEFVYCAGLFDYLTDSVCKEFMAVLYDMVAPGGLLVATNVDSCNPIKHWLSYILEWPLIYRNSAEMLALRPEKASPEDTRVVSDTTGVNIYMEVRKPA
jgi:extracellular factor (EF) 3-hydroxypalmitic acid methyl ester biosynthesis protein